MSREIAGEREMAIIGLVKVNDQVAQIGLQEKCGARLCAIHCDIWSALGIEQAWKSQSPDQPHPQDLLRMAFKEGGIAVARVLLMSGVDRYIWARLFLSQGDRRFTMDCRAACGIGQALRWNLPIMMDELALQASNRYAHAGPQTTSEPSGLPS